MLMDTQYKKKTELTKSRSKSVEMLYVAEVKLLSTWNVQLKLQDILCKSKANHKEKKTAISIEKKKK